jgi:cell division protein FtsB
MKNPTYKQLYKEIDKAAQKIVVLVNTQQELEVEVQSLREERDDLENYNRALRNLMSFLLEDADNYRG